MTSKLIVFFSLFFLFSCGTTEKEKVQATPLEKKVANWYNLGLMTTQRDLNTLQFYADSIENVSHKISTDYKAMGVLLQSFVYTKIAKENEAYKYLIEAKSLLKNSDADTLKTKVYNALGQFFKTSGDFVTAHKNFMQSLKIAEKSGNKFEIAAANSNLGDLYLVKNDLKTGEKHLKIALDLMKNHKNRTTYLVTSHTMANFFGMTGNIKKALELDDEGLQICDENEYNRLKVTFLDNKANCFFYTNQLDSAEYYFGECLKLDRLNQNAKQESDSYLNLANVAYARKNTGKTLAYMDSALHLAQQTNYQLGFLKAGEIKMRLFKDNQDYKKLSEVQEEFHEKYKQLINEKKTKAIEQYNTIYETEKKEIKLLKSKIDLANKEKLIQSKNNLLILITILTFALSGIGYLTYRQLKLRNQQQEQEFELKSAIKEIESQNDLQNQRLLISRDLHDNIGAQLTFIISSVENLNYSFDIQNPQITGQLDKINNFAKSTIVELRDTIWAMNSNEITNEDLKDRIYNFLEKAQGVTESIKFNFTISEKLTHYSFSSLMGINVYRVLQEAVNNAIKYAKATEINVHIHETDSTIHIQVRDNGIGFNINDVELGNGLMNMRKRMEEIDGDLSIESKANEGTTIVLTCPKTK